MAILQATCPLCSRPIALTLHREFWRHGPIRRRCKGSWKTPEHAAEIVRRRAKKVGK